MAKYYVNERQYETSLSGLMIDQDSEIRYGLFLEPVNGNMESYFQKDPQWSDPEREKVIYLYADENNLREVKKLVYYSWIKPDDPNATEMEVELDEVDRAYLNGLLTQWFGDYQYPIDSTKCSG